MKKYVLLVAVLLLASFFAGTAKAELLNRGNGLIYDDLLDITWLEHANYAGGTLKWDYAMSWAENLNFQGYDDWRLPASDTSCMGKNCTGSEMGQLFYNYNVTSDAPGIFNDVRPYMYWSATDYDTDTSRAWRFHFNTGYQGTSSKTYARYAWAVRDGDSLPVVPEPTSLVLFIAGGISMAVVRFRKKIGE